MILRVDCRDKYEAQKLANLLFLKERGETFIREILDVIGSEVIVSLKDGSAHSIMLSDRHDVEEFADFMQSVSEGSHEVTGAVALDRTVEIVKASSD